MTGFRDLFEDPEIEPTSAYARQATSQLKHKLGMGLEAITDTGNNPHMIK